MNRRGFMRLLAGLPFIRSLPKPQYAHTFDAPKSIHCWQFREKGYSLAEMQNGWTYCYAFPVDLIHIQRYKTILERRKLDGITRQFSKGEIS